MGYKFTFRSVPISTDWIRVLRKDTDRRYFTAPEVQPEVLMAPGLSKLARQRLLEEVPF